MSEKLSYEKLEQKIEALEQEIDICKQSERIMKVYKNAIEDSLDIIAAVDRNYKYLFANQTYLEYHQLNGEKIIGKYFG
ncbi:MAG: hypothetical protein GY707_18805, partial [Desulfobacteraceae bacterium]|nr:hypothetical protein [Desulfobacteraceae bacterium]